MTDAPSACEILNLLAEYVEADAEMHAATYQSSAWCIARDRVEPLENALCALSPAHLRALAAPSPTPTPAPAEAEANEWANIPPEIVQLVNILGPVKWGRTVPRTLEEHGAGMSNSVRLTAEHFGQGDEPRGMNMLLLEGTETVLAYTGTSPHSETISSALAGAWNLLVDHCRLAQALAPAPAGEAE